MATGDLEQLWTYHKATSATNSHNLVSKALASENISLGVILSPVTDDNRIKGKYTVKTILDKVTLYDVPYLDMSGKTRANGVGVFLTFEAGQYVVLARLDKTGRRAIIGAYAPSGGNKDLLDLGKYPQPDGVDKYQGLSNTRQFDYTDQPTQGSLFYAPYNREMISKRGKLSMEIYPLVTRNQSTVCAPNSGQNASLPGSYYCVDYNGNWTQATSSLKYETSANQVTVTEGTRQSDVEKALAEQAKALKRARAEITKARASGYEFIDGWIVPIDKVINKYGGNSDLGQCAFSFLEIFDLIDLLLRALEGLSKLIIDQLNWFDKGIIPWLNSLVESFGSYSLDLGLVTIDLNLSLLNDVSVWLDFNTGIPLVDTALGYYVNNFLAENIKGSLADWLGLDWSKRYSGSSGSPPPTLTIFPNAFTTSLTGTGGYKNRKGQLNSLNTDLKRRTDAISRGKNASDVTNAIFFESPYDKLSLDLTDYLHYEGLYIKAISPFANSIIDHPAIDLAVFLYSLGVENASTIVSNLINSYYHHNFKAYYLSLITPVSVFYKEYALVLIVGYYFCFPDTSDEIADFIKNLWSVSELTTNVNLVLKALEDGNPLNARAILSNNLYISNPPNYISWIGRPENIVNYFSNSPIAFLTQYLLEGDPLLYLVEVIRLTTKDDIKLFADVYLKLQNLTSKLFSYPVAPDNLPTEEGLSPYYITNTYYPQIDMRLGSVSPLNYIEAQLRGQNALQLAISAYRNELQITREYATNIEDLSVASMAQCYLAEALSLAQRPLCYYDSSARNITRYTRLFNWVRGNYQPLNNTNHIGLPCSLLFFSTNWDNSDPLTSLENTLQSYWRVYNIDPSIMAGARLSKFLSQNYSYISNLPLNTIKLSITNGFRTGFTNLDAQKLVEQNLYSINSFSDLGMRLLLGELSLEQLQIIELECNLPSFTINYLNTVTERITNPTGFIVTLMSFIVEGFTRASRLIRNLPPELSQLSLRDFVTSPYYLQEKDNIAACFALIRDACYPIELFDTINLSDIDSHVPLSEISKQEILTYLENPLLYKHPIRLYPLSRYA